MFRVRALVAENNEIVEKDVFLDNPSFYSRISDDRMYLDNDAYVLDCELLDKQPENKPVKIERVFTKEGLKEWANNRKNVKCIVKNCECIGFHSGNLCGRHFVQVKKLLVEKKISWAKFQENMKKKEKQNA